MPTLQDLLDQITAFRDARDWGQFHTPRQLATALAIECAELQETMLWKTDEQVEEMTESVAGRKKLEEELADVLIYSLLLAATTGIDPTHSVLNKLAANEQKYPVERSKGRAEKYTHLKPGK